MNRYEPAIKKPRRKRMAGTGDARRMVSNEAGETPQSLGARVGIAFSQNNGRDAKKMADGAAAKAGRKTYERRSFGKSGVVTACLQTSQPFLAGFQETLRPLPDTDRPN